jgi:hypothetical protein
MFSRSLSRPIAAGAAALAVAGGAYGIVRASSGTGPAAASTAAPPSGNARSGPAAGGAIGAVASVSTSGFTISTSAGQTVTIKSASAAGAIKKGVRVLVLGTVNGTTITAGQIIVQPKSATASPTKVVPFQAGAPSASKQVGQIPASYTQGSGTIVGGTPANKATEATLAAYPGGIVDRVVKLRNGEYEVHNIGVNWPHHIFVNRGFKVIGAD